MPATDRDIIAEPIHKKSKRTFAGLALWLERNRPVVKLSTKDATDAIARTHRCITEFSPGKGHRIQGSMGEAFEQVAEQAAEKAADCHHLQCILGEESRWLEGHCCLLL
jgi:hypothetical protein